jgi:hypothetical protein
MRDHRGIHAPEHQRGMHVHAERPACFSDQRLPKAGAPFWLEGAVCGCAMTMQTWLSLLSTTPLCRGCERGRHEDLR